MHHLVEPPARPVEPFTRMIAGIYVRVSSIISLQGLMLTING